MKLNHISRIIGAILAFYTMELVFAAGESVPTWIAPVTYIKLVAVFLAVFSIIIIFDKKEYIRKHKKTAFYLFVIPTMAVSLYLAGFTVYGNFTSETGGPVHWHLDYEVWVCDEKLDLVNPTGLTNKIGSPLFHEHNDDRIHVEGTVQDLDNIDLGSYFEVVGGALTNEGYLKYPTADGNIVEASTGDSCPNGQTGELQVFINGVKSDNPEEHLMYPHALVPPGDCVIVEFGPSKSTTQRICKSWEVQGWSYDNYVEKRGEY